MCVILFCLSFVGVLNLNIGSYIKGILGSSITDNLIEGDVSIYTIDCIELMFATARHYDEENDTAKIEKLEDELSNIQEDLMSSVVNDVRDTKVVLSKESETLLRKFVVKSFAYQLSIDNAASSGGARAEVIVGGVLFLANILFSFVMAIVAVVAFAAYLRGFLKGEENDKHTKLDFFVPLLMILPLGGMLPLASVLTIMEVAGAMIASLFFSSVAIAICLIQRLVADVRIAQEVKIIVPRIATLALAFIVVGCCFAPCFKATYDVQFSGKSATAKYEVSLDASSMAKLITTAEQQKSEYYIRQYDKYTEDATAICERLPNYTVKEFMAGDGLVAKTYAQLLLVDGVLAQISYEGADMLSLGFFVLIIVMVLLGFYLGGTIVGGKTASAANLGLVIAILLFLICSLALSIATIEIANKTMFDIRTSLFELHLDGGLVAAMIMTIAMLVFNAIPDKVWCKKKKDVVIQNE